MPFWLLTLSHQHVIRVTSWKPWLQEEAWFCLAWLWGGSAVLDRCWDVRPLSGPGRGVGGAGLSLAPSPWLQAPQEPRCGEDAVWSSPELLFGT